MAVGTATGEDRARIAAEQAISSSLLDITIDGARGILFNVTGGSNLTLFEVKQAADIIKETAHPDVNLIFGAVIDPAMQDNLRITVIATGFDNNNMRTRMARYTHPQLKQSIESLTSKDDSNEKKIAQEPDENNFEEQITVDTGNLDIPAFLRKRK